jgi:transcriptional regulator with XRE-family HTH domain
MDAQLQAQLAKVTRLEQQLLQQIELSKASARVAQLEKQLHDTSVPFRVREDTREAESSERVGEFNKKARGRIASVARRVADLQKRTVTEPPHNPRGTTNNLPPGEALRSRR